MSKTVSKLRIGVGIDPRDLNKGAASVRRTLRGLARFAKFTGVAAAGAFGAAALGMASLAREGLSAVDAQAKMARSVDGTVDGLRALQIAGGDAGVATDQVGGAMQRMGAILGKAAREGAGAAYRALEDLGLSAQELIDLDVDERLAAIADRAKSLGLSAQETSDILAQLGIRNKELALLVMQGGDAIRAARQEVSDFGLSLDKDAIAGVERANDAMARIGYVAEGFRNQLATSLAPALEQAALRFRDLLVAGGPLQQAISALSEAFSRLIARFSDPAFLEVVVSIGTSLVNAARVAADAVVLLADNAEIAGAAMIALGAAMAFFSGPLGLAIAAVAGGIAILATHLGDAETAADELAIAERELSEAIAAVDTKNADAVASGEEMIRTHIDRARAALQAAKAEYALARAEASRALDQERLKAEGPFQNLFADEAIAQAREDLEGVDAYYDELVGRHEEHLNRLSRTLEGFQRSKFPTQGTVPTSTPAGSGGAIDPVVDENLDLPTELQRLVKILDPAVARAEEMALGMKILDRALAQGAITQEEYNLRVGQLRDRFNSVPAAAGGAAASLKAIKKEISAADRVNQEFASGMDRAISTLINNLGQGKSAVRAFVVEVLKMLAIRKISSLFGGGGSGGGFAPFFGGIGKNALGTDHWRGGLTWVGERGPEIVDLPAGSKVVPNHRIGGMGGGPSITFAPQIDARGADAGALQRIEAALERASNEFEMRVVGAVQSARKRKVLP